VPEPVLFARVRLAMSADPAVERPAVAQVNVDLNGRLIRAQAAGETVRVAIDQVCHRLRLRIQRGARAWTATRGGPAAGSGDERQHGRRPPGRLPQRRSHVAGDRAIVRRKSYSLAHGTPDEAAADAGLLGYDFHLFTEKSTGEDCVIYWSGDGYRLVLAHPRAGRLGPVDPLITVSPAPAPRLSEGSAIARLEVSGEPFVFFVNAGTGRGNVLYHRYDGQYGLISPAD
jgi:hypothetical protein